MAQASTTSLASGIADAIAAVGTQARLAGILGVRQQVISKWLHQGWVPLRRAEEIEDKLKIERLRLVNPRIRALITSNRGAATDENTVTDK